MVLGTPSSLNPCAAVILTASLLHLSGVTALTTITDWNLGYSTFYGGEPDRMDPNSPSYGTKDGSCGYGVLNKGDWPYWTVAALATSNKFFKDGPVEGCGTCFEVQCLESGPLGDKPGSCQEDPNQRSIVVQITDQCPECGPNHMDLQALTWAKIAKPSPSGGRINIQYRRVECAPPSTLSITVDNNLGSDGWIRLQISKTGGRAAVAKVEMRSSSGGGGDWQSMNNLWGASWELRRAPPPPLDIRVTDDQGNSVEAAGVIKAYQTGQLSTDVQFNIQDPGDVQPSGSTLGRPARIQSNATFVSRSPGAAEVQAFGGPPEDGASSPGSSPAVPPPSSSPSSSDSGGSGGSEESDSGSSSSNGQSPSSVSPASPSPGAGSRSASPSDSPSTSMNFWPETLLSPSPSGGSPSASPSSSSPGGSWSPSYSLGSSSASPSTSPSSNSPGGSWNPKPSSSSPGGSWSPKPSSSSPGGFWSPKP